MILSQEKQINNVKVFQKISHVSKKPEWDVYLTSAKVHIINYIIVAK